jgi:hypothetical protein
MVTPDLPEDRESADRQADPTRRRCCSWRGVDAAAREVTEFADHEVRQALENVSGVAR